MLVCNVSLRPKRSAAALSVDMIEAAAALDDVATASIVFATLVDDPGSASETLDAYLGAVMLEAAGADEIYDATISSPVIVVVSIAEAATAGDTPDGALVSAMVTWDLASLSNATLSGGNLVVTNTATGYCGAMVAATSGKTTGKYYYEMTMTAVTAGGDRGIGIGTPTSTYANMGNNATTGVVHFPSGSVYSNGSLVTSFIGGSGWLAGTVFGLAIDLDHRKFWIKNLTTGTDWNGVFADDPATNAGGFAIPAGTMVPFAIFGGSDSASGNVYTANFGASTFTGTVPSGFTAGWL